MKKTIKKTNKKVTEEVNIKKAPAKKVSTKKAAVKEMPKEKVEKEIVIKKMSKKTKVCLIVLLILLALGGCFYKFGIVATVNGKPITRFAYVQELQKNDKQAVLNQMIQDSLIQSEAKKKNVKVEQKEIDDYLANVTAQLKAQGMTLDDALKSDGVTKDEVIKYFTIQKLEEKLASPSSVEITQDQIDKFLADNKAYLPTGKSQDELNALAKQQLQTQAANTAVTTWLDNLKKSAKIIYR